MSGVHPVPVLVDGSEQAWDLSCESVDGAWRLRLVGPESTWTGFGPDVFEALRVLRRDLDGAGIRIGVAGALPNVWASGMQRDMGSGHTAYELEARHTGRRPPTVKTLDVVALDLVGTVADQDAFHGRWLATVPGAEG